MTGSIYDRYFDLVMHTLHKNIPQYPISTEFRSATGNHPVYRVRELCNTLAFTEVFEEKMKAADDPLSKWFTQYPELINRSEKIRQDVKFLIHELAKKSYFFESLNSDGILDPQPTALAYADYIRDLKDPVQVLAHFYANTHALLFDSGNLKGTFPQKIDPSYEGTDAGMTFCYVDELSCKQFEECLKELDCNYVDGAKFTEEQEEIFLAEIKVTYATLFHKVFPEQEQWCKALKDIYIPKQSALASPVEEKTVRAWPEVSNSCSTSVVSGLWRRIDASIQEIAKVTSNISRTHGL